MTTLTFKHVAGEKRLVEKGGAGDDQNVFGSKKGSTMKIAWKRGLLGLIGIAAILGGGALYRESIQAREASFLKQCRAATAASQWEDLQGLGAKWTKWHPQSAQAWVFRADAAQHLGDFAAAASYLEEIPLSDPKGLPARVSLAALQFGTLNRPLDGARTCEQILAIEPRTTSAHQQLIEFFALTLQRKRLDYQIRYAIECSREPPQSYVYMYLMDTMRLASGVELNSRWIAAYPDTELYQVAQVLQLPEPESGVKNGQVTDKYSLAESLLARYPTNLELLAYQLDLSIRRGNVAEVLAILQRLPPEADEDSRFWRAKGWLHLSREELRKARESLEQAIRLYPQDRNARAWLADVFRREGKLTEAEPLHEIVQFSRGLRDRITALGSSPKIPTEILQDLADFAEKCGDFPIANGLKHRLQPR